MGIGELFRVLLGLFGYDGAKSGASKALIVCVAGAFAFVCWWSGLLGWVVGLRPGDLSEGAILIGGVTFFGVVVVVGVAAWGGGAGAKAAELDLLRDGILRLGRIRTACDILCRGQRLAYAQVSNLEEDLDRLGQALEELKKSF